MHQKCRTNVRTGQIVCWPNLRNTPVINVALHPLVEFLMLAQVIDDDLSYEWQFLPVDLHRGGSSRKEMVKTSTTSVVQLAMAVILFPSWNMVLLAKIGGKHADVG